MIAVGSDAYKERFCRQFVAGHRPYRPESLAWPTLDMAAQERLRAIPFWPEVLFTERRAEHACRMAVFDAALLRPRMLPWAGGIALSLLRLAALLPRRRGGAG